jgi:hypothetical protein
MTCFKAVWKHTFVNTIQAQDHDGMRSKPHSIPLLHVFCLAMDHADVLQKTLLYRASKLDCDVCPLKPQCCPKEPARKIPRDIQEHARDVARSFAGTEGFEQSRRERKKIEMRFAHLKRILRLGRLRLRGPRGAQDEFVLAAIAQNLRRLASLVARPPPTQALRTA